MGFAFGVDDGAALPGGGVGIGVGGGDGDGEDEEMNAMVRIHVLVRMGRCSEFEETFFFGGGWGEEWDLPRCFVFEYGCWWR